MNKSRWFKRVILSLLLIVSSIALFFYGDIDVSNFLLVVTPLETLALYFVNRKESNGSEEYMGLTLDDLDQLLSTAITSFISIVILYFSS